MLNLKYRRRKTEASRTTNENREVNTPVSATLAPDRSPLTAADRCDRCGARAYVRVTLQSGGELFFCLHHAREHEASLRKVAVHFEDESERIDAEAAVPER
jgi:hypothetical protein